MEIITFNYSKDKDELLSNSYLLKDKNNNALLVDPSCNYDGIINFIDNNKIKLKGILLTHSHFDHMKGINRTIKKYNVPLYVHEKDIDGLTDIDKNCSCYYKIPVVIEYKPIIIQDNDKIDILNEDIYVIYTPFHTIGSVCYYLPNSKILISGDTLFCLTIGRSDLPTSTPKEKESTFKKLLEFNYETKKISTINNNQLMK